MLRSWTAQLCGPLSFLFACLFWIWLLWFFFLGVCLFFCLFLFGCLFDFFFWMGAGVWTEWNIIKKSPKPVMFLSTYDSCTVCTLLFFLCKIKFLFFPPIYCLLVLTMGTCKIKAFRTNNMIFHLVWRIQHCLCQYSVRKKSWMKWAYRKTFPPFFFFAMKVGEGNSCGEIASTYCNNLLCFLSLFCFLDC